MAAHCRTGGAARQGRMEHHPRAIIGLMNAPTPLPWFVAVGASGQRGLCDLMALLSELPADLGAAVLVVLHRPWDVVSHLQQVLARKSNMPVVIVEQGDRFRAGTVYIGEPAAHLTLAALSIKKIVADPHRGYGSRTVDLLFRSVASEGGGRMIGVILSGELDDGARGIAAIHDCGGLTMVLTPGDFSKGMPENAISYDGPIDTIGSPGSIAAAIIQAAGGTAASSALRYRPLSAV
jgi:two-component system chemotaxis response regulator CheB